MKTMLKVEDLHVYYDAIHAIKGISFEVGEGEIVTLIGANGAGKTTTLHAISGLLKPRSGKITFMDQDLLTTKTHMIVKNGLAQVPEGRRIFSELTVQENTYLRGAMLGYSRSFMNEKYEEIIKFAELEDFQERPFKQLSSGMKSRLAFSIACLVNPDILILDEVLSVGDGAFRKKSGDKMKQILSGGVTGILVSHSIEQVRELCNKVLWIDHGKQIAFGDDVDRLCNAYEESLITRTVPVSEEEIDRLVGNWKERCIREREERNRTEAQKLQSVLEAGNSEAALEAALNIISRKKPELLRSKADLKNS